MHLAPGLRGPGVDLLLRREESRSHQTVLLPVALSDLVQIGFGPAGLVVVEDRIMGVGEVAAHGQLHLPDRLMVFERSIDTVVLHLAGIDPRRRRKAREAGNGGCLKENTLAALAEIVRLNAEFAEQRDFGSDIEFVGFLPADRIVGPVAQAQSGIGRIAGAELIGAAARVDRLVVDKAPVAADLVVTHDTVGGFELHQVEHVAQRSEEFLLGKHPTDGTRREEAETMAGREVFGAVVAEVTLDEIAVVVVVGDTAGDTLMAVGQCLLGVGLGRVGDVLLRLLIEEQGTDGVPAEGPGVVERRLEIERTRTARRLAERQVLLTDERGRSEDQIIVVIATYRQVLRRLLRAGQMQVILSVEGDLGAGRQSGGDPVAKVLLEVDRRGGRIPELLAISPLGQFDVRIDDVAARTGQRAVGIEKRKCVG